METKIGNVGYRLVRNATPTADKAPYLGVAVPVGSLAYGDILQRMLDKGTFMTRATAQYFLNEFYEFAAETIAEEMVRINMGAISIYPMIGGSFDSEDDEFRSLRNTLYIGATFSREIRDAMQGIIPVGLAEIAKGSVKISSLMDLESKEYHLIDGLKEFRIAGIDLTVPDGEDESLTLVASDGLTKVSDITVVFSEDGQRITCALASPVEAGSYKVRLVSHGLDPAAPLVTTMYPVKVKAAATPPGPELTGVHAPGIESPMIREESSVWFDGTGLDGWTTGRDSIWCKNNRAEEAEFVRMDGDGSGAAVEFDGGMLKADEGAWSVLTDLGIVEGSEVRFKVTINGQSAEIVATVAEE